MKKAILLIMVLMFSVTGALALNDTGPKEPVKYSIEVVDNETKAVTFVKEFKDVTQLKETLEVFAYKDAYKLKNSIEKDGFLIKTFEGTTGKTLTLKLNLAFNCSECIDGSRFCYYTCPRDDSLICISEERCTGGTKKGKP